MNNRHSSIHTTLREKTIIDSRVQRSEDHAPIQRGGLNRKSASRYLEMTMNSLVRTMPISQRIFSKFIHIKPISVSSDFIGGTLARPNALLFGAVFAFIGTLCAYLLAKNLGYMLSGFETIGAFFIGWLVGLIYDYLKLMVTGRP